MSIPGVNMYITTCLHGVDLRFTPRCYLCKPWPEDSPVFTINPSGGHRHEGEWCAKCVENGKAEARAPLEAERDLWKRWKRDWAIKDKQWTDAPEARAPLEAEIERLREATKAMADHMDGKHDNDPSGCLVRDHLPTLRAALEEPTP